MKNEDSIYYDEGEPIYKTIDKTEKNGCLWFLILCLIGSGIWIYLIVLFIKYLMGD